MHSRELFLLALGEFGLFPFEFAFGAGDGHTLAGSVSDEVGFEFGEGGEDVKEELAQGVGGVVNAASDLEGDAAVDQVVADGSSVGDGAGQAVELGHDEGVAGANGGERLGKPGPVLVGAGESVIEVDAFTRDAQLLKSLLLGGEVLPIGRAAGVADFEVHKIRCNVRSPFTASLCVPVL